MKILLANSIFHPNIIGGAEKFAHILACRLSSRGHHVDVLASDGRSGSSRQLSRRRVDGVSGRIHEAVAEGLYDLLDQDGSHSLATRAVHHAMNARSRRWRSLAREVIDEIRPDLLHTNTVVGMTTAIWLAARDAGLPVVHTLHDYHLLCPRTTLLRSNGSECLDSPLPCRLLAWAKMRASAAVDVVTSPSRFVLDRHLCGGGFSTAEARVVPNAVESLPDAIPDRSGRDTVTGLYLGQLDGHKGIPLLLEAIAALAAGPGNERLRFVFAGEGPLANDVQSFAAADPDRVRYAGFVKGREKEDLLGEADFLVLPSVWNDNFPLVILDAFSHGIPVIGSARGGIPEVVTDGRNGRIVQPQSAAIAEAMRAYVVDDRLRLRHGADAAATARDYTVDRQVDMFEEIYAELLRGRQTDSTQTT